LIEGKYYFISYVASMPDYIHWTYHNRVTDIHPFTWSKNVEDHFKHETKRYEKETPLELRSSNFYFSIPHVKIISWQEITKEEYEIFKGEK